MQQENRRSFIKQSLATSMAFSFSGLIRAHGEEGGGTTTWNPDVTTYFDTTSNIEYTIIATGDDYTIWNPDDATCDTPPITAPPSIKTLVSIDVNFTGTADHLKDPNIKSNDLGWWRWSGRTCTGTLTYYILDSNSGTLAPISCKVKTGGYRASEELKGPEGMPTENQNIEDDFWSKKPWLTGSETGWPPGSFDLSTSFHVATVAGYYVMPDGKINTKIDGRDCQRSLMKVHYKSRPNGSSGCIVFEDKNEFSEFKKWMDERKKSSNKVPMIVTYNQKLLPVFKLSSGELLKSDNPKIPVAIPCY